MVPLKCVTPISSVLHACSQPRWHRKMLEYVQFSDAQGSYSNLLLEKSFTLKYPYPSEF